MFCNIFVYRICPLITKMFPNASENLVDILKTRYISKTDTALQFYTTKLTDYSVERWRLVRAMVYVFLWTTLECSVELRFKLYSTVLGSQHKWHSLHKIFSINSDFYTNQVNWVLLHRRPFTRVLCSPLFSHHLPLLLIMTENAFYKGQEQGWWTRLSFKSFH